MKTLFWRGNITKCQDPARESQAENYLDDDDEQETIFMDPSSKQQIPSYDMLFHGLKNLTMTVPRMHQIEGFRL